MTLGSISSINPASIYESLQSGSLSPSTLMMQVQMLVTKDFDDQMRAVGKQIKLLNDVKQTYRDRINQAQNFMVQNPNTSRKDGKRYFDASAQQLSELFGAMTEIHYDLNDLSLSEKPFMISDSGSNHKLYQDGLADQVNGHVSSKDIADFFSKCSSMEDSSEACEFAKKVGDDNTSLPFYFGHTNNKFADGSPKFSVMSESIEKLVEQMKGKLSDVEQEAEELGTNLNQLSAQRKAAMDGTYQMMHKIEEMKSNTIQKIQ